MSVRRALSSTAVLLAAIVAVAAIVRLALLGRESYWIDEIHSLLQARLSFGAMIADLVARDVHPPLYHTLLWVWIRLVGEGEAATRLLSVMAGTAALLPLYGIGRMLYGSPTGLLAAWLLSLNGFAVFYARETRPYSLLLLTALMATWLLLRWIADAGSRGGAIAYVAGATLLAYTHIYGLFLLLAHGLFVLGWVRVLRRRFLLAAAAVAVLFLPWVPVLVGHVAWVQEGFWIPAIRSTDPFVWAARWAGFNATLAGIFGLLILAGLLRPPGSDAAASTASAPAQPLLLLWIAVPIGVPILASFIGEPVFSPKCVVVSFGAFALLAARGLLWLPSRVAPFAVTAVTVALLLPLPSDIHLTRRKQQWREMADIVRAEAARGTLIVADAPIEPFLRFYVPKTPIVWLEAPIRFGRLEARARTHRVMHVQIQPARSPHEPALRRRWRALDEHRLFRARAVRYEVPAARPSSAEPRKP